MKKKSNLSLGSRSPIIKLLFAIIVLSLMNCRIMGETPSSPDQPDTPSLENSKRVAVNETRENMPLTLGKQLENPFSVENMTKALERIKEENSESLGDAGILSKAVEQVEVNTTDLYVRFLPADSVQNELLHSNPDLILFPFPLDYEITSQGNYFVDETLPEDSKINWLYATVKPEFMVPKGVKFEILAELFLPENSDQYSEEITSDEVLSRSGNYAIMDDNLVTALIVTAFDLTGNADQLRLSEAEIKAFDNETVRTKTTTNVCKRHKFLWWRWETCTKHYNPSGYIRVKTPKGNVGLKGIEITAWRWFQSGYARTNADGYYHMSERFSHLWATNKPLYTIIFKGQKDNNHWKTKLSLFGAFVLWTDWHTAGTHHPNGFDMTFQPSSDSWGRAILNNAIYDYMVHAKTDGVSLPPNNLSIAHQENSNLTSSAPMLKNHFNMSASYEWVWGDYATSIGYKLLSWGFPDLLLRYTKNINDYNKITSIVWHELVHASHLQRLKSEKGNNFANENWSSNVYQQVSNSLRDGNPYGKKGASRWQIIALTEGWANFRQWELSKRYLNYEIYPATNGFQPTFDDYDPINSIAYYYGGMFKKLFDIGCSRVNLEKAICNYTIPEFRARLIQLNPSLSAKITEIVEPYV